MELGVAGKRVITGHTHMQGGARYGTLHAEWTNTAAVSPSRKTADM